MNTWLWSVRRDSHDERFSGFQGGFMGWFLIKRFNFFVSVVMKKAYGDQTKLTKSIHSHYINAIKTPLDRNGCAVFPMSVSFFSGKEQTFTGFLH